ncbi:MAG: zf-TFIIB domain-containing protein, partial [Gemmataceae bacterium]
GGPRQAGAAACGFCQSDFTLHERDLQTVCPHCLARVSDRARFCHHCGTGLVPELNAGHNTPLVCPACADERQLTSRRLGQEQVTVLECGGCAGMWLGHDAFELLVQRARREANPARRRIGPVRDKAPAPECDARGSFYRPCAVCRELMSRQHYAGASGVIIDVCRPHGVWFDGQELAAILDWLRSGGQPRETRPRPPQYDVDVAREPLVSQPASPLLAALGTLVAFLLPE